MILFSEPPISGCEHPFEKKYLHCTDRIGTFPALQQSKWSLQENYERNISYDKTLI